MKIQIEQVSKRFGHFTALDNINLEIPSGELVALLGPSGCGKTTLLRIIAGMEKADKGRIIFGGEDASQWAVQERKVGFVFQHYALFRHLSVFENVAFGLRVKPRKERPTEAAITARVTELLHLVQLEKFSTRFPWQLSGGQRQRVALARALAVEPQVLLLDEPFGALDTRVRKALRRWLRRLHNDMSISSVFVTHDQEEALEVADRIVVMNEGRIEQVGTPDDVYTHPVSPFVYGFLGQVNALPGELTAPWKALQEPAARGEHTSFIRPHDIEIHLSPQSESISGRIQDIHPVGPLVRIEVEVSGTFIEVELSRHQADSLALAHAQTIWLTPRKIKYFDIAPSLLHSEGSGI